MTFAQLGLTGPILEAIAAKGYTEPTPVQSRTIPVALEGGDLLVSSQTGSGKTAAFVLPCLQRLADLPRVAGAGPRILVLAPTRELAQQVHRAVLDYSRGQRGTRCVAVVGGASFGEQYKALRGPVDIVVATPGRLIDHIERGRLDLGRVQTLVLDEADRMLDMGFIDDIETIIGRTPPTRQTMLFSATLDGVVGGLARRVTRDAKRIEVAPEAASDSQIEQRMLFADDVGHKTRLLESLLRAGEDGQAVVFTATKRSAEGLCAGLREQGFAAAALHGDMQQRDRNQTLRQLRDGSTRVLVATDVAARGIDVPGLSHVINFDLPRQAEDYVHRIGRTGRAGRQGTAVSLVGHDQRHMVRAIERYTARSIAVCVIPGLEPKVRSRPSPGAGRGGDTRSAGRPPAGRGAAPARPDGSRESGWGRRAPSRDRWSGR
jgi:superfamily II DNA/RNA helicase